MAINEHLMTFCEKCHFKYKQQ